MSTKILFVISSPRSGSTMLERMLESHSMIKGGPEPHLLTPLAHLGVWDNDDKAPYDHVLAAESQRLFVQNLPNKERDYWDACRAYCDVLYGRFMDGANEKVCLDKTPAYALILPFMMKVFPDAKYIVLTRHPIAVFSSYANSFFDGNYEVAQNYNPLLNRYVPALAGFLRQEEVPHFHLRYEDLVAEPEKWMEKVYDYIGVPFEEETVDYGEKANDDNGRKGLGDPIGVKKHSRPALSSVSKWAKELASDNAKLEFMQNIIEQLAPEDLEAIGCPVDGLWKPLKELSGKTIKAKKTRLSKYRIQRKLIVNLRTAAQKQGLFGKMLRKIQLVCNVLLRE